MAGSVSVVSWFDRLPHLRVYAVSRGHVIEQVYDGSAWTTGEFDEVGNSVGTTSWQAGGEPHIRVYVSATGGKITEYCWDNGYWYVGQYEGHGMGAVATSWVDADGQAHIRVYARSVEDSYSEQCWDGDGWYAGQYSRP